MLITTTALAALLMASAPAPQNEPAPSKVDSAALESDELAKGRADKAILALEKRVEAAPHDPALLINLGIAHAQSGDEATAHSLFKRALASPEPIELETADGDTIDSRRLARKAIRMLERGEFAPKLTRRD